MNSPDEKLLPLPSSGIIDDLMDARKGTLEWYGRAYDVMTFNKGYENKIANAAKKVKSGILIYQSVEKLTGVPWELIGALHNMESSCNFSGCLHNGEKIIGTGRKTTLVPKGRGPFATWADAAVDALKWDGAAAIVNWTFEKMLRFAEHYNGVGYLKFHPYESSPYIWACTSINDGTGKYVADGKWDPSADTHKQVGVAAIFKSLEMNGDIKPVRENLVV